MTAHHRQPAGAPNSTGGQFAPGGRAESAVDLSLDNDETFEPRATAFDDFPEAERHAEAFARAGQWAVVEHTHTFHAEEVHDGAENEVTSDDVFEVHVLESESDLDAFLERGGYLIDRTCDTEESTRQAESYSHPYSDLVEERRATTFRPEPAVPDLMRDGLRDAVVRAVYDYETTVDGEPLDQDLHELPDELREEAANDFDDFVDESNPLLTRLRREHPGYDLRNLAADFHLSRQGHGAGFFDRGLGEIGDELQRRARGYGSLDVLIQGGGQVD